MMIYGFQFRVSLIRGDFIFFLLSGIFLYRMHVRTFQATSGMDGEMDGTMKHMQASTPVKVLSGAFGSLYMQLLTILTIVFVYYLIIGHIAIDDPVGALGMVIVSWLTAVCIGVLFMTLTPWSPGIMGKAKMIYVRLMFITSGKMFLGNTIPDSLLPYFDWNPLFHIIDQARGFIFINYYPHKTSLIYPLKVCIVLLILGMMFDFVTRRSASVSWGKSRF
jgi:ABC-type polysaccharide/polyol phosphate export permease